MLSSNFKHHPRSKSVGAQSENPMPLNISISAPTTPRNDSESYCKTISQIRISQRKEEERKLQEQKEESSSTAEYYSAYEDESEKTSSEDSELGIKEENPRLMGKKAKQLPPSGGYNVISSLPLNEIPRRHRTFHSPRRHQTLYSPRRHKTLHSPRRHKTLHLSRHTLHSPRHKLGSPRSTKKRLERKGYLDDNDDSDGPLPPIPKIKIPHLKPLDYRVTLSKKLELKHPCSPRLSESRNHLEETKKVIELQKMLFELRVSFWRIENSREHAIENYLSLASEAGFRVCENCKRLLRDLKLVKKKGNYHVKQISKRKKIHYKCRHKTYDQHFITTPAGKFFPLSLEK